MADYTDKGSRAAQSPEQDLRPSGADKARNSTVWRPSFIKPNWECLSKTLVVVLTYC